MNKSFMKHVSVILTVITFITIFYATTEFKCVAASVDNEMNINTYKSENLKNQLIKLNDKKQKHELELKKINEKNAKKRKHYAYLQRKYSYILNLHKTNKNVDFGMSELLYTEQICKEKNVPMDLVLAVIEKESMFNSKAKNKYSSATGYGQLLKSTAKSVYENMGMPRSSRGGLPKKYNTRNHKKLATNKKLNISMTTTYLARNIKVYKTPKKAVEMYFGHKSYRKRVAYSRSINKLMKKYNSSLYSCIQNIPK